MKICSYAIVLNSFQQDQVIDGATEDLVDMLMKWRHSGFNVFCVPRIQPGDEEAMENLARYTCPPRVDSEDI